ncbi:PRC-barrel domain-containing protein [Halegenticoccus soli]|uniref:PRC-barrel domain-containing protein n=1 Tax=Halegenticoccus soli TaxID=1985678 RepID=UPI000C6C9A0D|nr:hypothetical protein [Halegenticoccus soli]
MAHDFTEDDLGKPVVSSDGRRVGSVSDVEGGRAHVRADPDMPGELKEALGVDDTLTSTMEHEHVSRVTEDEVRLADLP